VKSKDKLPRSAVLIHNPAAACLHCAGHLRVTVAPSGMTVDYIRSYLPKDQNAVQRNGQVAYSYTIPAP